MCLKQHTIVKYESGPETALQLFKIGSQGLLEDMPGNIEVHDMTIQESCVTIQESCVSLPPADRYKML